jgi:PAS domain S-box-containing protein
MLLYLARVKAIPMKSGGTGSGKGSHVRRSSGHIDSAKNRSLRSLKEMGCQLERASPDAIITADAKGAIIFCSQGAAKLLELLPGEAIGQNMGSFCKGSLPETSKILTQVESGESLRNHITEMITATGRIVPVSLAVTPIRNGTGKFAGIICMAHDLTQIRRLENELADAEHLAILGELSASLAHEIKNPLAGIKGAIDVIRDSLPSTHAHREVLDDVLHEVNRIDKIVRDLLNYAKPKAATLSDIDLPEIAHRMAAMARKSSQNNSHSIEVIQLTEIPKFTGDETQLEQALLNLLLNSQNAMQSGGQIQIRLTYDGDENAICIEVQDNGPGIPEEIGRQVFQPFFTTRTDGIGLGLATCLKNIQYHGGSINLSSAEGQGTTFTITLPLLCRI